jgi:asparagine synthase (glutamine-hydrolysing)
MCHSGNVKADLPPDHISGEAQQVLVMGALVGVLSKRNVDTAPLVIAMLQELAHRGNQCYEIVTPTTVVSAQSIIELEKQLSVLPSVSIGRNVSSCKGPESLKAQDGKVVFVGRMLCGSADLDVLKIVGDEEKSPEEIGKRILRCFDGSYAFASASDGQMLIGRDPLGTMPLYYGEDESVCVVASERKALWKIGIRDARSFPPGNLARVNQRGFSFKPMWTLRLRHSSRIKASTAMSHLKGLLEESIRKRLCDAGNIGIAFSGGLDSSIIARVIQKSGTSARLISVCLEGQPGALHADEAAKALQLPITIQTYNAKEVEDTLAKVLWLIEEPDVMKVSVAIPLFWSAQVASKLGCDVMFTGQGADELFGGYRKYLTLCKTKGFEEVAEMLLRDTLTSYDTNFQRDEPLCADNKIELCLPFADASVVRYALNLPIYMKIQSADDLFRKRILRQLAKSLGVPAFIAERLKKAIQYETGVDKALRDLARTKGLTLHEYIKQIFNKIYPALEKTK